MEIKTVGIACDHAGYALKKFVIEYLESHNIPFKDYGTYSDMSCDYPDFAHALGDAISKGDVYPGIGICGSGLHNSHASTTTQTCSFYQDALSTTRQPRKLLKNSLRLLLKAVATSAEYKR